jgi:acyl carrier protein
MATNAVAQRLKKMGVGLISAHSGLRFLMTILTSLRTRTHPTLAVINMLDWSLLLPPETLRLDVFSLIAQFPSTQHVLSTKALPASKISMVTQEVYSCTYTESEVVHVLKHMVNEALGKKLEDATSTFMEAGLDSLGIVELRQSISNNFGVELPATAMFDYPSAASLGSFVASKQRVEAAALSSAQPSRFEHSANEFSDKISALVLQVIGTNIPRDQPLMEAGLDSLSSLELRNALESAFDVSLSATFLFDHPTIAGIESYLSQYWSTDQMDPVLGQELQDFNKLSQTQGSTIALTAVSCRYPSDHGSANSCSEGVFRSFSTGDGVQSVVPSTRWDVDAHYHPDGVTPAMYVRIGGWMEDIDIFDQNLFRLSKRQVSVPCKRSSQTCTFFSLYYLITNPLFHAVKVWAWTLRPGCCLNTVLSCSRAAAMA